jgi:predicted chitinase
MAMQLERRHLEALGVKRALIDRYLDELNRKLPQRGIDTPLRIAHFLAQTLHESGRLAVREENLNYSAARLRAVFPKYFDAASAAACAGKPERIGNRVYANRLGNGGEESGDGYRYRGRGFIQLTGKDNYRRFSGWVGEDCLPVPDRVSDVYPIDSALHFWEARRLNEAADADDVREATRRVNGGAIGLAERIRILDEAKRVLGWNGTTTAATASADASHRVEATSLYLRSRPEVAASTRIASLPQGTPVTVLGRADPDGWVRVRTVVGGRIAEGYVAKRHLAPVARPRGRTRIAARVAPPLARARDRSRTRRAATTARAAEARAPLPVAHLAEGRGDVTRRRDGGRAHPLGESGRPGRNGRTPAECVAQLVRIARYLDPESSAHLRYRAKPQSTVCNVYSHDFCYLAGAYLPRVWWTEAAIARLRSGEAVPIEYDRSVREMTANLLFNWLDDHGEGFGWHRELDLDVLQAAANAGEVCLIVAHRVQADAPGHVSMVVPEHDGTAARRDARGAVVRPVESDAGRTNHTAAVKPSAWWQSARFRDAAFWRHP